MNDLEQRLFTFAIRTIKYLRKFSTIEEFRVIRYQLTKSSTSSGANYEEAQAGSSKADFNNKIRISLREMRESNYWLRIIKELIESEDSELTSLLKESHELKNILGSIVQKTRTNK
jgi:four helix bundle protein